MTQITLALSKGRIFEVTVLLLAMQGCLSVGSLARKLGQYQVKIH